MQRRRSVCQRMTERQQSHTVEEDGNTNITGGTSGGTEPPVKTMNNGK
jgi:hypothetical protein